MTFNEFKYQRPDVDEYAKKIMELSDILKDKDELNTCVELIEEINKIRTEFSTMRILCDIRQSIDTNDKFYNEEQDYFIEAGPRAKLADNYFFNVLLNHTLLHLFEDKFGMQWFNQMRTENKCFSPDIVSYLSEEDKLVNKYEKLLASARINFDGKINNLSQMSFYLQSTDRDIRKNASLRVANYMKSIEDEIDNIYDKLVSVRTKMAQTMGYENYVEFGYYRLGRTDYNYKDIQKYRKTILEEVVPVCEKLIDAQKKRLAIDDLKFYDLPLQYKEGNPNPRGTTDELVAKAYQMYCELGRETGDFFKFMMDSKLLDLDAKANKMGGGYTEYIPLYKAPFIFSNFNGTSADIDVLTHEAGHAFEVYQASNRLSVPDIFWPTLEACEIHSMSMEFFAHPYMEYFFGREASKYRYKHLVESIMFLPYGVAVDEFQEGVYLNPSLSIQKRKELWRKIEKKYMPWKDYDGIEYYTNGSYWQKQGHIFSNAFYYIDYTLAQVCAFNFYLDDLKDHKEAFKRYCDLCLLGGSKSFYGLLAASNQENPMEMGVVKKVMKELTKVVKKLEKEI